MNSKFYLLTNLRIIGINSSECSGFINNSVLNGKGNMNHQRFYEIQDALTS